jgi:hypothetical protein
MSRLNKFIHLSGLERQLLVEAIVWLGLSRMAIMMPFRWIAPCLGRQMATTPNTGHRHRHELELVRLISWAINTAGRHVPWDCKCLARAIAGKQMLRRRKIPSTLYLGLAKEENVGLKAHAWLKSGDIILTGHLEMPEYTVISTFA